MQPVAMRVWTSTISGSTTTYSYDGECRTLTYGLDRAGRMRSVAGVLGGQTTNYASQASYEAHGGLKSVALGNNLVESWSYIPSRQQPWKIQLGTLAQPSSAEEFLYEYCATPQFLGGSCAANNGNVMGQKRGSLGGVQTVYSYDYLNRLLSATESGNGPGYARTYGYDAYGNRWVESNSGVALSSFTPTSAANFAANNRLLINNAAYDDSGNQTAIGGYTFKWDGENRMVESVIGGVTTAYVYDGEGRRVKKVKTTTAPATTTETRFVHNAAGALAAEYGPSEAEGDTEYFMTDHLGSTRLVTSRSGVPKRAFDYLPFGEEIPQGVSGRGALYPLDGATPASGKKFTGQMRDGETGLDYFLARYYSGAQGRFTSPDEFTGGIVDPFTGGQVGQTGPLPYADITDPQTLNKYAYVRNNPLRYTDPDGHCTDVLTCGISLGEAAAAIGGYITAAAGGAVGGLVVYLASPAVGGSAPSPNPGHYFAESVENSFAMSRNDQAQGRPAQAQGQQSTPADPQDDKPRGPVKTKDASGVTAGGQATNEHGQKLAPSGRPQVNNVSSNTREAARNKANKGSGTVEHKKTTRGQSHFHTKRGTGEKKRDNVHYNYPE